MAAKLEKDIVVRLQHEPIDVASCTEHLGDPSVGAHTIFLGTTRRWTDDRETVRLEYDVYDEMAIEVMREIAAEAMQGFGARGVVMVHRKGLVPVGESSVLVASTAPHRDESFRATRYLIDELKKRVPIWKREHFADGSTEWVVPQREVEAE